MKILYITTKPLVPNNSGYTIRAFNILKYLKSKGHEITLISFITRNEYEQIKENEEINAISNKFVPIFINRKIAYFNSFKSIFTGKPFKAEYYNFATAKTIINKEIHAENYDCIAGYMYLTHQFIKDFKNKILWIDLIDSISMLYERRLKTCKSILNKLFLMIERKRVLKIEKECVECFNLVTMISEIDKQHLSKYFKADKVLIVKNGVNIDGRISTEYNQNEIVYLGDMEYIQNHDAVIWFIDNVLPNIIKRNPNIILKIVGKNPKEELYKHCKNNKNIKITGRVDDVKKELLTGALLICPIKISSGLQNKVLEALSVGVPAIVTPQVANPISSDKNVLIQAETIQEWEEKIGLIINDISYRTQLSEMSVTFISDNYTWEGQIGILEENLNCIKNNKKVLIVHNLFSLVGGAEVIACNQYKLLKEKGYQVYFWATDKKPYFDDNYQYINYFTKYSGGIINYLKNPLKYYYNYKAKNDLQKFINLVKPDIIHIHSLENITSSVLDNCKKIPTVYTIHDTNLFCPNGRYMFGHCICDSEHSCKKGNYFNCLFNHCTNNIELALRRIILFLIKYKRLKYIDKFISPSEAMRRIAIDAKTGVTIQNSVTINNFLSDTEFKNVEPNYSNKGYFLYIGRLSEEKGIHYLLNAMKSLPDDIMVHIVGQGPSEHKLKTLATEYKLHNVKFLGSKNRVEIKDEYRNCIATILPCNWFENFPTTVMESFILGKPVIASKTGGIPEQVEDNKTGLLFEMANVEELKQCIFKYWSNPQVVVEHGKNAYEKAKKQYTEERYYMELENVYKSILSEKVSEKC